MIKFITTFWLNEDWMKFFCIIIINNIYSIYVLLYTNILLKKNFKIYLYNFLKENEKDLIKMIFSMIFLTTIKTIKRPSKTE